MATALPSAEQLKDTVKEVVLGSDATDNTNPDSRARFLKYATIEENGEKFMNEASFIDAIAPAEEDYVSHEPHQECEWLSIVHGLTIVAQDTTQSIWTAIRCC